MHVPARFAAEITRREGAAGSAWLKSLPRLADKYCRAWRLEPDGDPLHGHVGVVLPVRRRGVPAMLKLSWLDVDTRGEPVALSTWHGAGAVLLLESAPADGALLLERLDPARTLRSVPIGEAVAIAATLLRRLTVAAPAGIPDLRAESERLVEKLPAEWARLGKPFPEPFVTAAVEYCRAARPGSWLVNRDLHYENVLAGSREPWLVIDPQPVAGDPEYGVIPLLWNRMRESTLDRKAAAIVAGAGLDAERVRAWTLVRAVRNWLWTIASGGFPDTERLAVIARWAACARSG